MWFICLAHPLLKVFIIHRNLPASQCEYQHRDVRGSHILIDPINLISERNEKLVWEIWDKIDLEINCLVSTKGHLLQFWELQSMHYQIFSMKSHHIKSNRSNALFTLSTRFQLQQKPWWQCQIHQTSDTNGAE